MKRLYFDTETTGFPPKEAAPLDQCPHIVQLAALLVDDEFGEMGCVYAIIRPDGWDIPEEAAAVHGITTEIARNFGIPIRQPLAVFSQFCRQCDEVVAHNIEFDLKIISYELQRLDAPNIASDKPRFCTMKTTTDICCLPGKYGNKWPKLVEAHKHFFDAGIDDAHDAMADVRACQRIHRHMLENNLC